MIEITNLSKWQGMSCVELKKVSAKCMSVSKFGNRIGDVVRKNGSWYFTRLSKWVPYEGSRGGKGAQNTETGEVVYGKDAESLLSGNKEQKSLWSGPEGAILNELKIAGKGNRIGLRELGKLTGIKPGSGQNPLSSELNQALVKLRKAGKIKVHDSGWGEPSFEIAEQTKPNTKTKIDSPISASTKKEWTSEIKARLKKFFIEDDYENADIEKTSDGIDAIDRAISFAEDMKGSRDYNVRELSKLENQAVTDMPEEERDRHINDAVNFIDKRLGGHISNSSQAEQQAQNYWFNKNGLDKHFINREEFASAVKDAWERKHK